MKTISFGIIGTGRIASEMAAAIGAVDGARMVAVASADEARARAFASRHGIERAHVGAAALIADGGVDAVYVANLNHLHADASVAALEAGKSVLCEKPFAVSAEEGERVLRAARQSGALFMEALWTHCLPVMRRIDQVIGEGTLGPATSLSSDCGFLLPPETSPRLYAREGGGALLDLGVYPVSLALRLFGPVDALDASTRWSDNGIDLETHALLRHENGAVSRVAASIVSALANETSIAFTNGAIKLASPVTGAERAEIIKAPTPPASDRGSRVKDRLKSAPALRRLKSAMRRGEFHSYGASRYAPQIAHFRDLLRQGARESDLIPHAHSRAVIETIDRIRAA